MFYGVITWYDKIAKYVKKQKALNYLINKKQIVQGPVVQNFFGLMSSLRGQLIKCFRT